MMRFISGLVIVLPVFLPLMVLAEAPVKIGVSLPLSGPASTYGVDMRNAIEFANKRFAGGRFQLVFEDDHCQPKDAVTIAHKFTTSDGIKYVLGFPCSGTILSTAPIFERTKTLVIAGLASAPAVSSAGEYIFRARPSDEPTIQLLADHLKGKHRVIGLLAEQTDYPQSMKQLLLGKLDPSITAKTEDFLSESSDLRAILTRLRTDGIDGMVVITQTEQAASIVVKQAQQLKLGIQIYGSNAMSSPVFLRLAGDAAEGVIVASLPATEDVLTPEGKKVLEEFTAAYGPLNSVDYAFYCAVESFRAMQAAIDSGEDPLKFLSSHEFEGVFGKYSFDRNGDLVGLKPSLRNVKKGTFQRLP